MVWISKNIYLQQWDVITHLCLNFDFGLIKPSLKLGHWWIISPYINNEYDYLCTPRYNDKKTEWGILFNQNTRRRKVETLSPKDEGVWLNKITNKCAFLFFSRDFLNSYFHGEQFCFHYPFYLLTVIHFVGVYIWTVSSPDNHSVSRQPQRLGHVTNHSMTSQWGHVIKHIWNLSGCG